MEIIDYYCKPIIEFNRWTIMFIGICIYGAYGLLHYDMWDTAEE